jgi:hypothetical protein
MTISKLHQQDVRYKKLTSNPRSAGITIVSFLYDSMAFIMSKGMAGPPTLLLDVLVYLYGIVAISLFLFFSTTIYES